AVDGHDVLSLPHTVSPGAVITFQDGDVLGLLAPLIPRPAPDDAVIQLRVVDEFLLVSCWNYRGKPTDVTRDQLSGWHTGFYLELHSRAEFADDDAFTAYAAGIAIKNRPVSKTIRHVSVVAGGGNMQLTYDPYRELIVSRTWNGKEEAVSHLEVESAGRSIEPFCPSTLFGSELLPE
ncbi:MAG: hypothetical protein WBG80_12645, partial [Bacteroidota bacterium]